MTSRRVMAGSHQLSDEQALVLACLEAGLGEADTCESTGLNAERLAAVVHDLEQLHVLPAAPDAPARRRASNDDDELPSGVEPWSGDSLPAGIASSHDLHAPVSEHDPGSGYPDRSARLNERGAARSSRSRPIGSCPSRQSPPVAH